MSEQWFVSILVSGGVREDETGIRWMDATTTRWSMPAATDRSDAICLALASLNTSERERAHMALSGRIVDLEQQKL